MSNSIPVKNNIKSSTLCSEDQYHSLYAESIRDPEAFWGREAARLDWFKPWTKVKDTSFEPPVHVRWFQGGELNASYNCIDRHLAKRGNQTAILWEPDNPKEAARKITYAEMAEQVNRMANVLKANGVKRGEFVTIYMPMIPEAAFAILACARIGAPHSVVFGGFSADALADRIKDCKAQYLITADIGLRAGKKIPLRVNVDEALKKVSVDKVFVTNRSGDALKLVAGRDVDLLTEMKAAATLCEPEHMNAEDPLFILYTSGSTNKPKGVLHTTAGYLLHASITHQYVFDYKEGEIYWCTADVGWVTGHSYIVYGPLANGATTLMFEGVPNYPTVSRFWEVIDKYKVNIFYTAPTAIRALMKEGDEPVKKTSRASIRVLGSVGEPINPEAWMWYYRVVGDERCPIVDTWWQTETGGILISPLPGATTLKPGSATLPFFGVQPVIVNEKGDVLQGACEGNLCITDSWPGQMVTVFGDHDRFRQTYFSTFPGKYFTGDGARRDADGYYWITGRVDDVLNISGHRIGTAEVESVLVAHPKVAEAAAVGFPHDIKGQGLYVYVTLNSGIVGDDALETELRNWVRHEIGAIVTPDKIQWAPQLPKTRSGKIMRRILRKIAENQLDSLGDTSTLADPSVVEDLIKHRK